ncbi:MAG: Fic family protein [Legionellales bacterium]|nr:Fic family protein [Legionellales bacterium]
MIENFENYNSNSLWKLLIDGNRQETSGSMGFDKREPGYLKGMFAGLNFILSTLDGELSAGFLIKLQNVCTAPVSTIQMYEVYENSQILIKEQPLKLDPELKDTENTFNLIFSGLHQNATEDGVKEIFEEILKKDSGYYFNKAGTVENITHDSPGLPENLLSTLKEGNWVVASHQSAEELTEQINLIFSNYNQDIKNSIDIDDKIHAIAQCIHSLEVLHPFLDGNCRTIVVLLINKLLIEQGLCPAILENPNRFDAYSIDELCIEIKNGMDLFNSYKNNDAINLPSGMEEDVVVYVNKNEVIARIIAQEALSQCTNWAKLSPKIQKKTLDLVSHALSSANGLNELNQTQLSAVITKIKELGNAAIYKKADMTFSLFKNTQSNYEVFFNQGYASYIYNTKNALDLTKLKTELHNSGTYCKIRPAGIQVQ